MSFLANETVTNTIQYNFTSSIVHYFYTPLSLSANETVIDTMSGVRNTAIGMVPIGVCSLVT